jgi:TrmH family RNA methyltransferase
MSESVLSRVRVVLYEPQNPVNIAAVVRAMKNMGVSSLSLVRPVEYDPYRLEGIAHDTNDIIDRITHFEDLDAALADCVYVAAYTARRRAAKWTATTPRESAAAIVPAVADGPAALLFGREDKGLPNDALDRAHVVVNIPTTDHASLNLAQAVLVALYELHLAAGDATRAIGPPRDAAPPATAEAYERLFANAAQALEIIAFFKTRFPEHIMRTVRSLAFRAAPDAREIELMRAMAIEVVRAMERERKQRATPPENADARAGEA